MDIQRIKDILNPKRIGKGISNYFTTKFSRKKDKGTDGVRERFSPLTVIMLIVLVLYAHCLRHLSNRASSVSISSCFRKSGYGTFRMSTIISLSGYRRIPAKS